MDKIVARESRKDKRQDGETLRKKIKTESGIRARDSFLSGSIVYSVDTLVRILRFSSIH